ncbi:hypothetical protein PFISCL1PPCAC_10297, partial [Pristionchus fissidentatus]
VFCRTAISNSEVDLKAVTASITPFHDLSSDDSSRSRTELLPRESVSALSFHSKKRFGMATSEKETTKKRPINAVPLHQKRK